jgi:hypothetical protein
MWNVRIIIYGIPWVKDIRMVSKDDFHFTFENKDEFFPVMDRGLGSFNSGGLQGHDERLHMAILLLKP